MVYLRVSAPDNCFGGIEYTVISVAGFWTIQPLSNNARQQVQNGRTACLARVPGEADHNQGVTRGRAGHDLPITLVMAVSLRFFMYISFSYISLKPTSPAPSLFATQILDHIEGGPPPCPLQLTWSSLVLARSLIGHSQARHVLHDHTFRICNNIASFQE